MNSQEGILRTENLTKRFGALSAANNVNYELKLNQMAGIVGPNGAGKTTFFNLVTGLYAPDSGSVFFEGRNITRLPPRSRVQMGIRRTFQLASTFGNLRVIDNIRLAYYQKQTRGRCSLSGMFLTGLERIHDDAIDRCLEELGFTRDAYTEVGSLSLGSKRKLELAMAIIGEPKVLLLDEPFAGLSEMEISQIVEMLRTRCARRMSVLIIEHKITWLKDLVDRVSVFVNGEIIADGTYQEALESVETRKSYWKIG
ncbi:MAG: ABC transporter ATP-binding protein [Bacillota bacterium]|nr:ABC transporter ATP-binding protein [Bacillota bacterium]MDI7249118.1 ABC transporter ATP-binding protein [Bacillota bacterium]